MYDVPIEDMYGRTAKNYGHPSPTPKKSWGAHQNTQVIQWFTRIIRRFRRSASPSDLERRRWYTGEQVHVRKQRERDEDGSDQVERTEILRAPHHYASKST